VLAYGNFVPLIKIGCCLILLFVKVKMYRFGFVEFYSQFSWLFPQDRGSVWIFVNNLIFMVTPRPTPKLQKHTLWAVPATYSLYSQLSSIAEGSFLHQQLEDVPYCGDKGTT
jgi:hypothetical protein